MPSTCDDDRVIAQTDLLVSDLSTTLCRADVDDLDAVIPRMLARIGAAAGADRMTLIEYDTSGMVVRTHRTGTPSADADDIRDAGAPWLPDDLPADDEVAAFECMPDDLPAPARSPAQAEALRRGVTRSATAVRVAVAGEPTCALIVEARECRRWPAPLLATLQVIGEVIAGALHRQRQAHALRRSREELARLTGQLEREDDESTCDDLVAPHFENIIGTSAPLRSSLMQVMEVAPTDSTVLLLGETGTGKELFARAIHDRGPRRSKPLVVVNCAALPPTLIESELFGHTRGAFTGATEARQGRFELANHGSLFLDEIGDLPLDLQTKLLRVLQEGTFERLGSSQTHTVDVRIVAATHRDLALAAADGRFRQDLYYRLNVFPIRVPPLRERRGDIPELVWYIIHKRQRVMHRAIKRVPETIMAALQRYGWPGNVRELENVIERALIHSTGDTLRLLDEPFVAAAPVPNCTLTAIERMHINEVLHACGWRINGAGNAAERLGMHPNTLRFRMKKLGIVRGGGLRAAGGPAGGATSH